MYIKHTLFLYFFYFSIFFLIFIWKQNKQHWKINNKNMLSKTTQLDWLKRKTKHSSYAKQKTRRERRSDRITWSHFPSTPWKNISFEQTLEPVVRGKNWNLTSSKGTWGLWEDLQEEQERIEADSGFQMLSCHCSVEWLATYSDLVEYGR